MHGDASPHSLSCQKTHNLRACNSPGNWLCLPCVPSVFSPQAPSCVAGKSRSTHLHHLDRLGLQHEPLRGHRPRLACAAGRATRGTSCMHTLHPCVYPRCSRMNGMHAQATAASSMALQRMHCRAHAFRAHVTLVRDHIAEKRMTRAQMCPCRLPMMTSTLRASGHASMPRVCMHTPTKPRNPAKATHPSCRRRPPPARPPAPCSASRPSRWTAS